MRIYRVEVDVSAEKDIELLTDWLCKKMSVLASSHYIDVMMVEIKSLSIFAELYHKSRYADIRAIHPHARHMVSHNRKWVYVFHVEDDVVVIDRIVPSKLIKK